MNPNELTIHEAREKLARKEISARELAQAVLARIRAVDSKIKAFVHLDEADMLAQADAVDSKIRNSKFEIRNSPLLGIPVAVKDVINVKGQPCWCCSKILRGANGRGYVAPYNATVIERLRAAGAVTFGRLNMDEFAMGSSTENSSIQVTHNPWDLERIPGGSSGGSAAAVAADETLAALGSDTGGSIRQPAAMCGCVGIKPSYGRVSRYGLVAFASSLDQIGHLAKDVTDAALLLGVIAGHDPRDSTSVKELVPDYVGALKRGASDVSPVPRHSVSGSREREMRGVKLGLPREYFVPGMDAEVEAAVRAAVAKYAELGAEIVEISLPHTEYAIATYYIIATAEASANLARFDGVRYGLRVEGGDPIEMYGRTRAAGFGPEVKRRIILGTYVLSSGYYDAYYLRAQKVRTLIRNDFLAAFQKCDAILTPTAPTAAFRIGEKTEDPLQMYLSDIFTISCNLAGICGISIPCGFTGGASFPCRDVSHVSGVTTTWLTPDGTHVQLAKENSEKTASKMLAPRLPIGLQILGKPFDEATILRVAHAYEQATQWHKERPIL